MRKTNFEMVREFHETYNVPILYTPQIPAPARVELRLDMIDEEYIKELRAAIAARDIVEIADAFTDMLYLCYGAALEFGFDADACFAEVHRANMSKLGLDGKPIFREDGKVLKGPNYMPPNIAAVLFGTATVDAMLPMSEGGLDGHDPACAEPKTARPELTITVSGPTGVGKTTMCGLIMALVEQNDLGDTAYISTAPSLASQRASAESVYGITEFVKISTLGLMPPSGDYNRDRRIVVLDQDTATIRNVEELTSLDTLVEEDDDAPAWTKDTFEKAEHRIGDEVIKPATGTLTKPGE